MNKKTISFLNLGCKLNQYELELLREMAEEGGYTVVNLEDNPEVCVVNTCSVTHSADQQSRNLIRRALKKAKEVYVTGCYTELAPSLLSSISPRVKVIPNTEKIPQFQRILGSPLHSVRRFSSHTRAFVKVQEGCNQFCTYCIIVYLRKSPRSRPLYEIVQEAKTLAEAGKQEIILTGIHIGKYGQDLQERTDLPTLVETILSEVPNVRVRLSSIEPEEITDKLLEMITSHPRVCPHVHLSVQSGSASVLKRMMRRYTPKDIANIIQSIWEKNPYVGIGADIIVGFPGESDEEFKETYSLLKSLPVSYLHVFRYSSRPGTLASLYPNQVNETVKKERSHILLELALNKYYTFRESCKHKTLPCIVEAEKDKPTGMTALMSDNYIRILIPTEEESMVNVKITGMKGYDTYGEVLS